MVDKCILDLGMSKPNRIERIVNSFDLGFSDFYEDENVRQLTLEKKLGKIENAERLKTIEECMNYSVFNQKGAKQPTAEIYAIDFPSDLRASIYLLLGGYYRQAILCLRNWFEIRLTGIYFGFVNTDRRHYREWKKGKRPAPIGKDLIKKLFSRAEFHKIDRKVQLHDKLKSLYSELSAFTHGAVLGRYALQSETDNVPRFNAQSVDLWCDFASRVFAELVFCYFLAYGKDAFHMSKQELRIMRRHLPDSYKLELRKGGIF
jgi:hypothetical protein